LVVLRKTTMPDSGADASIPSLQDEKFLTLLLFCKWLRGKEFPIQKLNPGRGRVQAACWYWIS
jgi:hypothetical protein